MAKAIPAFVCSHVFEDTRPILLVLHADGAWQLLCGDAHLGERPRLAGLGRLVERDPTLRELLDLPRDWTAERSAPGQPWIRSLVAEEA